MSEELTHIISGCVEWDRQSQEQLYRLYSKTLFKSCKLYARDNDEASDFLHDAFIQIFKTIHTYKHQGSFDGWIKRVTINCCLQQLRILKRIPEVELKNEFADQVDLDVNFDDHIKEIQFPKVLEEINKLPAKAALVIKLFVLEGLSHAEIANELNITVGTSKSQLNYARSILISKFA